MHGPINIRFTSTPNSLLSAIFISTRGCCILRRKRGQSAFRQLCQAPRVQASVYWYHVFDNSSDVLAPWATARSVCPLIRSCFQLCNILHALITSIPCEILTYHVTCIHCQSIYVSWEVRLVPLHTKEKTDSNSEGLFYWTHNNKERKIILNWMVWSMFGFTTYFDSLLLCNLPQY